MKLLLRAAAMAFVVWLTFQVIDGLTFGGDWIALVLVVALLAFANAFIRPVLKLLALPARILTLGLATLVVNVGVVALVIWAAGQLSLGVTSTGWTATILGALMISVLSSIVSMIITN